jgi:hypothetical protein
MSDRIFNRETQQAEREELLGKYKTAITKVQLINDLKNGLGAEIKKNPNKARIIEKTRFQKFMFKLKKLFTKF